MTRALTWLLALGVLDVTAAALFCTIAATGHNDAGFWLAGAIVCWLALPMVIILAERAIAPDRLASRLDRHAQWLDDHQVWQAWATEAVEDLQRHVAAMQLHRVGLLGKRTDRLRTADGSILYVDEAPSDMEPSRDPEGVIVGYRLKARKGAVQ